MQYKDWINFRFCLFCRTACAVGLLLFSSVLPLQADEAKALQFFESRIRPVLIKHCYECHSDNNKEVKGALFLDTAAGLLKGGDSGPAIVPGKPDESPLMEALRYDGLEMPPAGRLPKNIIADFEQWIRNGAIDPRKGKAPVLVPRTINIEEGRKFWAFQPLKKTTVPTVADSDWSISPIDRFILQKLEAAGLTPAPEADRRTLIRRTYFDLIGLPPKPDDVEQFVNDTSPEAFTKVVDKLLASPQFGVHWGRHWLDVARYADSNGGDFNATFHNGWRYRDYVVNAFNNDKPYDKFIREQIAGDLLSHNSREQQAEQMIATGFLMLGTKMLSERDKEKLRMDVVDEQLSTVGSAFMALTLGCARCHDHKFDPIPTADYYALAGIFRSTKTLEGESQKYVSTWTRRNLPAEPAHQAAFNKHAEAQKALLKKVKTAKEKLQQAKLVLAELNNELTIDDVDAIKTGKWVASSYTKSFVGKGYLHDNRAGKGEKSVKFPVTVGKTARYEVRVSYTHGGGRANNVPVLINHSAGTTKVLLNQQLAPKIKKLFSAIGQFEFKAKQPGFVELSNRGTTGHVIADAVQLVEVDSAGQSVMNKSDAATKQAEVAKKTITAIKATLKTLETDKKKLEAAAPEPLPQAFAADEFEEIGDCKICIRGEHKNRGAVAKRGFLQVAQLATDPQFDQSESGRRQLAEWIASPEHPLTARVMVNRIWYHLTGRGIVASVDNFGELGERPTHPELLDYLASDFIAKGWSVKQIIRQIVLSRSYQMGSGHREECWKVDAENKLFWRAHRRRLPAESLRDSLLAISNQLDLKPGKSPVPGLGTLVTTNSANPKQYSRKASTKRSLYLPIIRNELPPILSLFDFADPDLVTGKRAVTNVPAQALLLMNSPFVMDCADKTAEHLLSSAGEGNQQLVEAAYRLVLSRPPTKTESERAAQFLREQVSPGNSKESQTNARKRALSQFIHVLFASTEFRIQS